jgi:hypothetical protein
MDDLSVTDMHMKQSSMAMMGNKLKVEFLSENKTGPGTRYRWIGKMMGLDMDFTVIVTKWIEGKEKSWETIGEAKMLIYSWYRMHLLVTQRYDGSEAELSITYERPKGWFARIISWFFADLYCNWCLKSMLTDCKKMVEAQKINPLAAS